MPGDRLLGTLLRSLQSYTDHQDTPRILGTASSLLTTLNNPLNVTLLTSQLLSAPAIWTHPDGLVTCSRCLSVFHAAAQALFRHEDDVRKPVNGLKPAKLQPERTLPKHDWVKAVIEGADEHSPRWRHALVMGGLLLGLRSPESEHLSRSLRNTLEDAFIAAVNLSLEEPLDDGLGEQSIALVLNHCFQFLSDPQRAMLDYDRLLPVLMRATFHSSEGLQSAYFLGTIDHDVYMTSERQLQWPERSKSFGMVSALAASPLLSALGPLSRLVGHSIEQVTDPQLVILVFNDLESFSRTLSLQWRQNKLSEVDRADEGDYLEQETYGKTAPVLWKLLKSTLFAVVIMLRSAMSRLLSEACLSNDDVAPHLAAQALQTLHSLFFISTRMSSSSFSQYTFVHLTSIDILTAYPRRAEAFIHSIKPSDLSIIPPHPLDRCLDLFFLNTAEHFTLVLPTVVSEDVLVPAAAPYLMSGGNNNLLPIFEAAHSLMLAVFSAPQNAESTSKHLAFYIETLFNVFPANVSARQFRLAFKTLLQLSSPPAALAAAQPFLAATLLELLHERALHASKIPLQPHSSSLPPDDEETALPLSEQSVLALTILDTFPQLTLDLLDEWLPITAELVNRIDDDAMREHCKEHFWHILVGGGMDPDRSGLCHAWWSTQGGREMVLFGREMSEERAAMMSGARSDHRDGPKL